MKPLLRKVCRGQVSIVKMFSCSTDTQLEIVLGTEGNTIRKSSITTEISVPLTHESMDPLQKKNSCDFCQDYCTTFLNSSDKNLVVFKGVEHMEVQRVLVQVIQKMS